MTLTLVLWRSRLTWRWLALGLLVGAGLCVAGVAMTAARTTQTAFDRVHAAAMGDSLTISHGQHPDLAEAQLAAIDGVETLHHRVGFAMSVDETEASDIQAFIGLWDEETYPAGFVLLDGRFPDPTRADEVAISPGAVERADLDVGTTVDLVHLAPVFRDDGPIDFEMTPMTATVVGVLSHPRELFDDESSHFGAMMMSPGFTREAAATRVWSETGVIVQDAAARERVEERAQALGWDVNQSSEIDGAVARSSSSPVVVTLAVIAVLVALATLLVGTLAVARDIGAHRDDAVELLALGMTSRQLRAVGLAQALTIGLIAGFLAVTGTALGSAVGSVGWAAHVDPRTGVHPDLVVVGVVAVVALVWSVLVGWFGARHSRHVQEGSNPLTVPTWVPSRPVPIATSALIVADRRSRLASGAALGGLSVAVLFAVAVFASSLAGLVDQPSRYGYRGDAVVRQQYGDLDPAELERRLGDERVEAVIGFGQTTFVVDETHPVSGVTVFPVIGPARASMAAGRAPVANDEILAGASTLETIGADIGERVLIRRLPGPDDRFDSSFEPPAVEVTIVGSPVIAPIAMGLGPQPARLDEGLWVRVETLRSVGDQPDFPEWATVDLVDGAEPAEVIADNPPDRDSVAWPSDIEWFTDAEPSEVDQARSALPLIMATFVVTLLAIGALAAQTQLSDVRRQQRQYALLDALGYTRGQILRTVLLQATVAASVALLIGVPLGVVGGRVWWSSFSRSLGVVDTSDVRPLHMLALAAMVLASALIFSAVPALVAARTDAAAALEVDER